ncbi:MAG: NAD(P)-dependent oxidoreductase [Saprospiraceae bacterium]|nr:NAD(P)-dependent oxidoreductase [Candidatus Opimibacter iunctus]
MNVLVTGSSGRLGRSVVEMLRSKNIQCIGIDLLPSDTTEVLADIRDRSDIIKITREVDHVIHTAAMHGRHMDMNVPRSEFVETNITGTLNLLEASVGSRCKVIYLHKFYLSIWQVNGGHIQCSVGRRGAACNSTRYLRHYQADW